MLMAEERRPANRTLHGWAIAVLQEAGAIRECEEHCWMQHGADPHTRERARDIAGRKIAPKRSYRNLR
jgi:ferritin-like protein